MIPATYYDYIRLIHCIPSRTPNLNLDVKKLSPMLTQTLQELGQNTDQMCVKETEVAERTERIEALRSFSETLKPFQHEAITTAIRRDGRILLADDAGLGKKMQALGIALAYKDDWPVLVICGKGKEEAWSKMVQRWLAIPADDIHITKDARSILGFSAKRKKKTTTESSKKKTRKTKSNNDDDYGSDGVDDSSPENDGNNEDELLAELDEAIVLRSHHTFHILSYDTASRFEKQIKSRKFKIVIADDSHNLKQRSVSLGLKVSC